MTKFNVEMKEDASDPLSSDESLRSNESREGDNINPPGAFNDTRKQIKDIILSMDISVDERNTYQRNPNRHTGNKNNSDSLLSTNIPSEPSRRPDGQSMRNSQGKSNGSGGFFRTKSLSHEDKTSWSGDFQQTVGREK